MRGLPRGETVIRYAVGPSTSTLSRRWTTPPQRRREGSEEVDAVRRRVVNVVGHALRTPVTTLCGMAEALALAGDEPTRTTLAEAVVRNARMVERLLDQLLIAADVSTALPVDDPKSIDVEAAVESALGQLGAAPANVPSRYAPCRRLRAPARARPDAAARARQRVQVRRAEHGRHGRTSDGSTTIEVETTGDDLSDEEVEHAFELFYRGEHAVMRSAGLGTGLTVARTLARARGRRHHAAFAGDALDRHEDRVCLRERAEVRER